MCWGASRETEAIRTYSQPMSASIAATRSSSETGGVSTTPNSFCRSMKPRRSARNVALVRLQGCTTSSKTGALHAIQQAQLHVHDVLGVRIVVDEADQERAAEGEPPGLRVGRVAMLGDHRFDARTGFLLDVGKPGVDHPADRLFRNPRQAGDVVDGRAAARTVARPLLFALRRLALRHPSPSRSSLPLHSLRRPAGHRPKA